MMAHFDALNPRKLFVMSLIAFTSCHGNDGIPDIAQYYNYSTVEWERIDSTYYRPNTADWSPAIEQRIHPDFPRETAAEYWHLLQNAKTDFHQQTLPLRAASTPALRKALDHTEAMFDTVFVRCVEQEYYLRLFVEVYNEVMPPTIDELYCIFALSYKCKNTWSTSDIIQLIIAIISAIAILCTLYLARLQNKIAYDTLNKQLRQQFFTEYTKRRQEIMQQLPESLSEARIDDVSIPMRLYFDLCSEEYYLHKKGYIDNDVWKLWEDDMIINMKIQLFKDAWNTFSCSYSKEFVRFFSNIKDRADQNNYNEV